MCMYGHPVSYNLSWTGGCRHCSGTSCDIKAWRHAARRLIQSAQLPLGLHLLHEQDVRRQPCSTATVADDDKKQITRQRHVVCSTVHSPVLTSYCIHQRPTDFGHYSCRHWSSHSVRPDITWCACRGTAIVADRTLRIKFSRVPTADALVAHQIVKLEWN